MKEKATICKKQRGIGFRGAKVRGNDVIIS